MKIAAVCAVLCVLVISALAEDREIVEVGENTGGNKENTQKNKAYQTVYCLTEGMECEGEDIDSGWEVHARECTGRCNRNYNCVSAFYDADDICHLRANRCTKDELVESEGGRQFYRLKKREECSEETGEKFVAVNPWSRKFCLLKGKRCPTNGFDGGSLYRRPQTIYPDLACLIKCAKIRSCAGVDYYDIKRKQCDVRHQMCSDDELEDDDTAQNYIRLEVGQESCPGNREPVIPPGC